MKKIYLILILMAHAAWSSAQFNPGNFEMRLTLPGGEPGKMRVQMRAISSVVPTTNDFCVDLSFAIWWDNVANSNVADLDVVTANTYGGELSEANPIPGNSSGSGAANGLIVNFSLNNFFQFPTDWVLNEWVTIADVFICEMNNCSGGGFPPGVTAEDFLIQGFTGTLPNININAENDYTPTAGPLPVTLVSFDAQKLGDRSSQLNWITASESNSSHFAVQRSTDKRIWSTIGYVDAVGNSQLIQNYSFVDENVYNGLDSRMSVYYRLQLVDIDGQFKYSPIESVVFSKNGLAAVSEFLVYPNPASDGVQVEWETEPGDQPTSLELYDVTGKLVFTQDVAENSNQEYIDFGLTNIESGMYLLRIMSGDRAIEHKQIVVGQNR